MNSSSGLFFAHTTKFLWYVKVTSGASFRLGLWMGSTVAPTMIFSNPSFIFLRVHHRSMTSFVDSLWLCNENSSHFGQCSSSAARFIASILILKADPKPCCLIKLLWNWKFTVLGRAGAKKTLTRSSQSRDWDLQLIGLAHIQLEQEWRRVIIIIVCAPRVRPKIITEWTTWMHFKLGHFLSKEDTILSRMWNLSFNLASRSSKPTEFCLFTFVRRQLMEEIELVNLGRRAVMNSFLEGKRQTKNVTLLFDGCQDWGCLIYKWHKRGDTTWDNGSELYCTSLTIFFGAPFSGHSPDFFSKPGGTRSALWKIESCWSRISIQLELLLRSLQKMHIWHEQPFSGCAYQRSPSMVTPKPMTG